MALIGWLLVGLLVGVLPALLAGPVHRARVARLCWRFIFGLVAICIVLPFGLVLLMLLSAGDYEAIDEMWDLCSTDFAWLAGLSLGAALTSGLTALIPWQRSAAEQIFSRERARAATPRRRPARPLEWMYAGFGAAWYSLFGAIYAWTFPEQPNHFLTALALFVFVPAIFGGFCGLCADFNARARFQDGFKTGSVTRRFAFLAGTAASLASGAGVLAVFAFVYPLRHSESSVWFGMAGVVIVLAVSPFLGAWLLDRRARAAARR